MEKFLSYTDALNLILDEVFPLSQEKIDFRESLNRILATDVFSDMDMPPFNKAAMDGYACRFEDIISEMAVIEEIPAGKLPLKEIGKGECAKIMTGARVPEGADTVIMVEHTKITDIQRIRFTGEKTSKNICFQGEDVKKGQQILLKGTVIQPHHIAILAATGCTFPEVFKHPRVAVLSTGDELVEPETVPNSSQIRNSNGHQIVAQCLNIGIKAHYAGNAPDNKEALQSILNQLIDNFDVVIISGGVSMGDYDFVPAILNEKGMKTILQGMNVKPGKRILVTKTIASHQSPITNVQSQKEGVNSESAPCLLPATCCFGLPGNPVSSFVLFEVLVKPFLLRLSGFNGKPKPLLMIMAEDYHRKDSEKMFFIPVKFSDDGKVQLIEYHGSAHIHAYSQSDGIMIVPEGIATIKKGETVYVRPI